MPSSFEPCGISQMLAMRAGQPCLVHAVGGLADTVHDGVTGFSFSGTSLHHQCQAMLDTSERALELFSNTQKWNELCAQAAAQRFLWADSALDYENQLCN
jgi:starch synthase